jgi:putative phage-type endonuclease
MITQYSVQYNKPCVIADDETNVDEIINYSLWFCGLKLVQSYGQKEHSGGAFQMSDLWHDLRKKNIGGSEIAALFGESPYLTHYKLWHIKRGDLEEDNLDQDERVMAGKFMEPAVIDWANWKWNLDFYQPKIYVEHWAVEGMACTPDAYSKSDPDLIAQIKIVDSTRFRPEFGWETEGDTIIKAPLGILLQVQHEMECTKKKQSALIVQVGGNRIFMMICEYDSEIGSILRKEVANFWLSPLPPAPDFKRDGPIIKTMKTKLPISEFDDLSEDADLYKLLSKAKKLDVSIKRDLDQLEAIKAEIYYLSENHASFQCKDIFVRFYDSKGGNRFRIIMEGTAL